MKRFLIRSGVTREQAEAVFTELGWVRMPAKLNMPEVIAYKSSWVQPGEQELANYLENTPLDCCYVLASNGCFDEAAQAFDAKRFLLPANEVVGARLAGGDEADELRSIGRLGLLAHGSFDKALFAKLTALLITPHPRWQRFALYALSNTSWDSFGTVLREALDARAFEDDLSAGAQAMLRELEASNWNAALYSE